MKNNRELLKKSGLINIFNTRLNFLNTLCIPAYTHIYSLGEVEERWKEGWLGEVEVAEDNKAQRVKEGRGRERVAR